MSEAELPLVAVTGIGLRVPGANDWAELWANLLAGRCELQRFAREALLAHGVPAQLADDPDFVPVHAALDEIACFDHALFGYSPREAELMDPQQRVFLESCWAALEDGACDPQREPGRVGVYAGCSASAYLVQLLRGDPSRLARLGEYALLLGNDKDFLATRVAYKLDLRGPALSVQTGCSSSLVAVHLACQSLIAGECELALAGGAAIAVPQVRGELYREGMIIARDGVCRPFARGASGTVRGSGVGVVLLELLEHALERGAPIHAVIRATATNNDGAARVGFTAPSIEGQAAVIREALALAELDPGQIGMVEGHGTGTELGDAIELRALARVLAPGGDSPACGLGSLKGNLGHLDAAAGVVGLIKACLAVREGLIPPTLHAKLPNAQLDPRFYLPAQPERFAKAGGPRYAGVSSFGIGGTNAHVIVQDHAGPRPRPGRTSGAREILLSAHDHEALGLMVSRLRARLEHAHELELDALAATLAGGRARLRARTSARVDSLAELRAWLEAGAPDRGVEVSMPPRGTPLLHLPSYPFARHRHWLDLSPSASPSPRVESGAASSGRVSELLARAWSEVLGVHERELELDTPVFDLGAESLHVAMFLAALPEQWRGQVDAGLVYSHPTIRALADHLEGSARAR